MTQRRRRQNKQTRICVRQPPASSRETIWNLLGLCLEKRAHTRSDFTKSSDLVGFYELARTYFTKFDK